MIVVLVRAFQMLSRDHGRPRHSIAFQMRNSEIKERVISIGFGQVLRFRCPTKQANRARMVGAATYTPQ
jgi:hypothetical protein